MQKTGLGRLHAQQSQVSGQNHQSLAARWQTAPRSRSLRKPAKRAKTAARQAARSTLLSPDSTVIGIDLGTSNSAVAVVKDGTPVIIPAEAGSRTIPSVIVLGKEEEALVGLAAVKAAAQNPLNAFYSVKRLMGRPYRDTIKEAGSLVYKLNEGSDGSTTLWSPAREQAYLPEEVSGMILKHLISCASDYLRSPVQGAVIAVPAHFNEQQRRATLKAAHLAGLQQVQLLQEPVAAAMAYGLQHNQEEEAILVFDLGGGTYDVSLLEGFEGIFEVLGTGGDSRLGGDDWDSAIVEWCLQQCQANHRAVIRSTPELLRQLYTAAQLAKVQLSSTTEATVHIPNSRAAPGAGIHLTRERLEALTKKLRRRLAPPLERLGRECHIEWNGRVLASSTPSTSFSSNGGNSKYAPKPLRVSQVVLVGSATRIPSVRHFVTELTGIEPKGWVNPEECVALGAAIQAGVLVGALAGKMELADGSYSAELHAVTTGFQGL